jgi:hypothetical protein
MAPSASPIAVRAGSAPAGASLPTPRAAPDASVLSALHRAAPTAPQRIVLTTRSWLVARPDVFQALRAGCYRVRTTPAWDHLLDCLDECPADIVIVDLDDANRCRRGHLLEMSGYRLVSLLGRLAALRRFALVVQTALDYVEIKDLARQGLHALVSPEMPADELVNTIQAATARVTTGRWQAEDASECAPRASGATRAHRLPDASEAQIPSNPETIWAH